MISSQEHTAGFSYFMSRAAEIPVKPLPLASSPTVCEGKGVKAISACVCVTTETHRVPAVMMRCISPLNDGCRFCPCCLVVAPALASVCSMPMSLYSHAWVYFLWIDRDTSSWTFIAPLSDVYLRGLTPVTGLYGLPPASHPCCLFCLRFAFFLLFFSLHDFAFHTFKTWAEWQWQDTDEGGVFSFGIYRRQEEGGKTSA